MMLIACKYEVVAVDRPTDALNALNERKGGFNLVLTDVHMPIMSGFDLLAIIQKEFNIPVIIISADNEPESMAKGMSCGASSYIVKPVNRSAVQNLWQFIYCEKPKVSDRRWLEPYRTVKNGPSKREDMDYSSSSNLKNERPLENRKRRISKGVDEEYDEESDEDDGKTATKKTRMVWTPKLHEKFVAAFNYLGPKKAVPKKILELMNIKGVSRTNIASHLQKYRLYLKGNKEPSQQPTGNRFWDFRYLTDGIHNPGVPTDDFLDHPRYGNTIHTLYNHRNIQQQWMNNQANLNQGLNDFQSFENKGYGASSYRTNYVGLQLCTRVGMIGLRQTDLDGGATSNIVNISHNGKRALEEYENQMMMPMNFNNDAQYGDAGNVFVNSESFQATPQMPVLDEHQPQQLDHGLDNFSELMRNTSAGSNNDFSYLLCNEGNQYNQEQGVEGIIMDPQFGINELFFDENYPAEI